MSASVKRIHRPGKGIGDIAELAYSQLSDVVMNVSNGGVNSGQCAIATAVCVADSVAIGAIPVSVSRPSPGGGGLLSDADEGRVMPDLSQSRTARQLGAAVLGGAAMVMAGSGAALADYGPPPPPVVVLPSGFSCVVTSQMVGGAGKTISFRLGGVAADLIIPRGAVRGAAQVTITQPAGSGSCSGGPGLGNAGYAGFHTLVGVGIQVQQRGQTLSRPLARPATLRLSGAAQIHAGDLFVGWRKTRFAVAHGSFAGHSLTAQVRASTDAALLVRDRARGRAVSAAPAALTGGFLAAALLQHGVQPGLGVLTAARPLAG